ncbi:hypothetical protein RND81_06G137000 [Saponaria officinalis]|uniref:Uncharacterized protein n=1 Tax=Saponaria officinalis TaxID=3572 RepID=A0AAW1KBL6_SAPOF
MCRLIFILTDASAFNSSSGRDIPSWKKPRMTHPPDSSVRKECHYCHNFGHTKSECYKLKECSHCGLKGHDKENCFGLRNAANRGVRGRGRGAGGRSVGNRFASANFKRGAHHVDVLPAAPEGTYVDDEQLFDPLTDHSPSQCGLQVQ